MVYQEINPGVWIPKNDGDFVEGVVIGKQEGIGTNKSRLYNLEVTPEEASRINSASNQVNVWGCKVLDDKMALVKIGNKIKITFKGLSEAKKGMNPAKLFKVEVALPE